MERVSVGRVRFAFVAASAAVLVALAAGGAGCKDDKEDPSAYIGQSVTLSGEVEEVFGQQAFRLEPDERFGQGLLVVTQGPVVLGTKNLEDGLELRVTGTVRQLEIVELEREMGWDLDPEIEAEFAQKPILVAQTVSLKDDPTASWSARPGVAPTPSEPRRTAPAASPPPGGGQGGQGAGQQGGQGGGGGY